MPEPASTHEITANRTRIVANGQSATVPHDNLARMSQAPHLAPHLLILGANSDLAQACALEWFSQGFRTFTLFSRSESPLGASLSARGATVHTRLVDATDTARVVAATREAIADGATTILCAWGILPDQPSYERDPIQLTNLLDVNVVGPQAALVAASQALMTNQRPGTLVVLSSSAAVRPRAENYLYGASKAALDAFAMSLADRVRPHDVRVLVVRPGFVRTKMTVGLRAKPLATTPSRVARDVVRAWRTQTPSLVVYSPRVLRPIFALIPLLPRALYRRFTRASPSDRARG